MMETTLRRILRLVKSPTHNLEQQGDRADMRVPEDYEDRLGRVRHADELKDSIPSSVSCQLFTTPPQGCPLSPPVRPGQHPRQPPQTSARREPRCSLVAMNKG
jgi:hypothetical protein